MVTSGAAPLIVCAFRRVRRGTSTEAFQTGDAGRARVQLPSEAGTPDMASGHADADQAGAHPYQHRFAGTRSRHATQLPRRRRERIPTCAGRQSGSLLSFFPLHTNVLT
jgi:hypothetical protein